MCKTLAPIALAFLATCTTACAADPAGPTGKWRLVTIDGHNPVSSTAELTIEAGRIGANVGCNGLGGAVQIKDGKLAVGDLVSTMMYCDGLMEQERAVSELLAADPQFRLEHGRLLLRGDAHSVELMPAG